MTPTYQVGVQDILGQMLRNAQALDALLQRAPAEVDPVTAAELAAALNRIAARTITHAGQIHRLLIDHGYDRRDGMDRRQTDDRRWRG